MPELPEVETICRDLLRLVRGLVFEDVRIIDRRVIRGGSGAFFHRSLVGRKIVDVRRRGKAVVLDLGGLCLVVQPMMTGQLVARSGPAEDVLLKETKIVFLLSKRRQLLYNDQRLFGRLQIVAREEDLDYIRQLGPDPLDKNFTVEVLAERLRQRRPAIKTVLMDGRCIAGIGNIYASEILFRCGIDPCQSAMRLSMPQMMRLHKAVLEVLCEAVAMGGTTVRNYRSGDGQSGQFQNVVRVYGRDGQPCQVCGREIVRIVQSQRSTFYCSHCQK
jgi:formamidopyrimidine-DNA glycosylase